MAVAVAVAVAVVEVEETCLVQAERGGRCVEAVEEVGKEVGVVVTGDLDMVDGRDGAEVARRDGVDESLHPVPGGGRTPSWGGGRGRGGLRVPHVALSLART